MRAVKVLLSTAAMVGASLTVVLPPAAASSTASMAQAATLAPTTAGMAPDTAAGSCWEIKKLNPGAADGDYWLLTPSMPEPQQFYCDMTTDGGGWVLVGKGRNGWNKNINAVGRASDLLTPDTTPMSARAAQYSGTTVDELLDGGRVDALPDGVRLRRAMDATGTNWQEVRMRFSKFGGWTWAFGALYPLSSWSFSGTTGKGSSGTGTTSKSFGSDQSFNRVYTVPNSSTGYGQGFAYGSNVPGTSSSTSFLWSRSGGGNAIPYTQVYIRPRVTSDAPGFTPIPDSGTKASSQPSVAESKALDDPWGVSGIAGTTSTEGDVEVQAFTQSGNRMYVGGNFAYVQQDGSGTGQVRQPFLAAFDVDTGQWISSFRPQLNEQVHALATLPNGDVVAGGEFTQANGRAAGALVALDPVTGATDPSFQVSVENHRTAGIDKVLALESFQGSLYIGGSFTHIVGGPSARMVYSANIGRVSATDGTPSTDWYGDLLNGTVNDLAGGAVSGGQDRMYAAGFFGQAGSTPALRAVAFQTAAGAPLATPAWNPVWSNSNNYQRAIDPVGSRVWVGGSEHDLFQFDNSSFDRVLGDIMYDKGDIQTISYGHGAVYAGCHCNYYDYQNAYTWPSLSPDWTRADGMNWFGAWDASTGARIPQFAPEMQSRLGSGIWASTTDSNGTVWAGGDITSVTTRTKSGAWAGGFTRFPLDDSTAPPTPGNFRVLSQTSTTVTLGWNAVSDPSGVHYQVLRDDRTIASTTRTSITVPTSSSGRFFLRAADSAGDGGNVSASTPVLVVGSGQIPPSPAFTWSADHSTLSVDGTGSTGAAGDITDYLWDFGDGAGAHGATYSHTYTAAGSYIVTLTVTDSSGTTASAARTVTVGAPPVNAAPSDSYGRQVYQDGPWAYYRLGDSAGATTAHDSGPDGRDGSYDSPASIAFGTAGAVQGTRDTAITTNGSSGFVVSPKTAAAPSTFTVEIWFKTTSTSGGRLIGYSSASSGLSTNYDRHLYLQSNGRLVFGVYPGQEQTVVSPSAYNDGQWHMAVASLAPTDGMRLYVDGALVGSNPNGTAQSYTGYWRVGGDRVWSGASSNYLAGSLDEAAIFDHALAPEQIAAEYATGSTVVNPPTNTPPTASFASTATDLTAHFDASGSRDPDGSIASYAWDFGDGSQGSGQLVDHTFPGADIYTVTLTVTDDRGARATIQQTVTTTAAPVDAVVVPEDARWAWKYDATAPPAGWNTLGFDASGWSTGAAPLGFGDASVTTDVDTFAATADRPLAAYFVRPFQVSDASKVTRLVLDTVANDGVAVYVNGTEVGRSNMPSGPLTNRTYASSAVNTRNAQPVTLVVPRGLLVDGTNVIAAEAHLNYRGTRDMTFKLKATMSTGGTDQPPVAAFATSMDNRTGTFDASASTDPDGSVMDWSWDFGDGTTAKGRSTTHTFSRPGTYTVTLSVMDDDGTVASTAHQVEATVPDDVVVPDGAIWAWKFDATPLPAKWNTPGFDASTWASGAATLGFGDPSVVTGIDSFADATDRPRAAYFVHSFQVADTTKVTALTLDTVADDGVVVYVNGTEVGRANMPSGAISDLTFASSAVRTKNAQQLTIDVPTSLLVDGANVIAAEAHLNYRRTPDMTFHLKATLTTP